MVISLGKCYGLIEKERFGMQLNCTVVDVILALREWNGGKLS